MIEPETIKLTAKPVSRPFFNCTILGDTSIPFVEPNVRPEREIQDIEGCIQNSKSSGIGCGDAALMCLQSITIVGAFCVCKNTALINSNQYGFVVDSGKVVFLKPGWHYVGYPFMDKILRYDINSDYIKVNNFQLIRINQNEIGFGINNTDLEVLLPGTHIRTNGAYVYKSRYTLDEDITEGPIKILTVKTGTVVVCYNKGVAEILQQGRYAVNSNGFMIANTLDITHQNFKFSRHKVLLEGGINMHVSGLLTYQIIDVAKLIKNVDFNSVQKFLEHIVEADLTKVFSTIYFEQIASSNYNEMIGLDENVGETRLYIYETIMKMIRPQADQWGMKIISFQLESIELADKAYASDYENATLQIAKSKAQLKANEAENLIKKRRAETEAGIEQLKAEIERDVKLIQAKAEADTTIIQADAQAEAIRKEGRAKAEAADLMRSNYGQELAKLGEKSKIAEGLKIHTLVMGDTRDAKQRLGQIGPKIGQGYPDKNQKMNNGDDGNPLYHQDL